MESLLFYENMPQQPQWHKRKRVNDMDTYFELWVRLTNYRAIGMERAKTRMTETQKKTERKRDTEKDRETEDRGKKSQVIARANWVQYEGKRAKRQTRGGDGGGGGGKLTLCLSLRP